MSALVKVVQNRWRGAFTGGKEKGARQAEVEAQWASFARDNYAKAKAKAEEALKAAK